MLTFLLNETSFNAIRLLLVVMSLITNNRLDIVTSLVRVPDGNIPPIIAEAGIVLALYTAANSPSTVKEPEMTVLPETFKFWCIVASSYTSNLSLASKSPNTNNRFNIFTSFVNVSAGKPPPLIADDGILFAGKLPIILPEALISVTFNVFSTLILPVAFILLISVLPLTNKSCFAVSKSSTNTLLYIVKSFNSVLNVNALPLTAYVGILLLG